MTNGNGINVRKRDGSLTPLNLDKIHKVVDEACEGLGSGVSASAVEMNSDLKIAYIHVITHEKLEDDEIILKLNSCKHYLSREVTSLINLKFSPKLVFRIDRSIDEMSNIEKVLRKEKVLNDLNKN